MSTFRLGRPPQTKEELWWTVYTVFGVRIPRTKVCADHCAPFDAFSDAYFGACTIRDGVYLLEPEPCSFFIWHASRGLAGKSKTLSVLALTFTYLMGSDLTILGGSMAQSTNVHEYIRTGMDYKNVPLGMVVDETTTKIVLSNRARIRPLTASQRTVRGPHPPVLLMDEVDEMDLMIYDAALGQPMEQDNYLGKKLTTRTVVSSTWQNPDGTLTEIFRRAEVRNQPIYRWCMYETSNAVDGWLTPAMIDEKKALVSEEMFRVEYLLGEPAIGNRAYNSEKVDAAFCLPFEPLNGPVDPDTGKHKGKVEKEFEEYRFADPMGDGMYVIAADWAKEDDWTVIGVARIDGRKPRLVYYVRMRRRPWPVMLGYFNRAQNEYAADGTHDSTGIGNVINDFLEHDDASGFKMVGEKRSIMLSEHVVAVENDQWEYPDIASMHREMLTCRVGDLYKNGGTEKFHLPDTVCMAALLHHRAARYVRPVNPQDVPKSGEPTELQRHFEHPQGDSLAEDRFEGWRTVGEVTVHGEDEYTFSA